MLCRAVNPGANNPLDDQGNYIYIPILQLLPCKPEENYVVLGKFHQHFHRNYLSVHSLKNMVKEKLLFWPQEELNIKSQFY